MKKTTLTVALACTLAFSLTTSSCIGSFSLTHKLVNWNRQVSNKFVNELVFFAFWVLPVYEVSAIADLLVLNSIEFWSGENPVVSGSKVIEGNDGRYLVKSDKKGYSITNLTDNTTTRLNYLPKQKSWAIENPDGSESIIFTFVDDSHIALPRPGSQLPIVVELSDAGLYAYSSLVTGMQYAAR